MNKIILDVFYIDILIIQSLKPSKYKKLLPYVSSNKFPKEGKITFTLSSIVSEDKAKELFLQVSDRITLINNGNVIFNITSSEYRKYNNLTSHENFFSSEINKNNTIQNNTIQNFDLPSKSKPNIQDMNLSNKCEIDKISLSRVKSRYDNLVRLRSNLGRNKPYPISKPEPLIKMPIYEKLLTSELSPYDEKNSIKIIKRELYRLARYSNSTETEDEIINIIKIINSLINKAKI